MGSIPDILQARSVPSFHSCGPKSGMDLVGFMYSSERSVPLAGDGTHGRFLPLAGTSPCSDTGSYRLKM
jgi:hypothetical protein